MVRRLFKAIFIVQQLLAGARACATSGLYWEEHTGRWDQRGRHATHWHALVGHCTRSAQAGADERDDQLDGGQLDRSLSDHVCRYAALQALSVYIHNVQGVRGHRAWSIFAHSKADLSAWKSCQLGHCSNIKNYTLYIVNRISILKFCSHLKLIHSYTSVIPWAFCRHMRLIGWRSRVRKSAWSIRLAVFHITNLSVKMSSTWWLLNNSFCIRPQIFVIHQSITHYIIYMLKLNELFVVLHS